MHELDDLSDEEVHTFAMAYAHVATREGEPGELRLWAAKMSLAVANELDARTSRRRALEASFGDDEADEAETTDGDAGPVD